MLSSYFQEYYTAEPTETGHEILQTCRFKNKGHSEKSISEGHIATDAEGRHRTGLSTSLFELSRYR